MKFVGAHRLAILILIGIATGIGCKREMVDDGIAPSPCVSGSSSTPSPNQCAPANDSAAPEAATEHADPESATRAQAESTRVMAERLKRTTETMDVAIVPYMANDRRVDLFRDRLTHSSDL